MLGTSIMNLGRQERKYIATGKQAPYKNSVIFFQGGHECLDILKDKCLNKYYFLRFFNRYAQFVISVRSTKSYNKYRYIPIYLVICT